MKIDTKSASKVARKLSLSFKIEKASSENSALGELVCNGYSTCTCYINPTQVLENKM